MSSVCEVGWAGPLSTTKVVYGGGGKGTCTACEVGEPVVNSESR